MMTTRESLTEIGRRQVEAYRTLGITPDEADRIEATFREARAIATRVLDNNSAVGPVLPDEWIDEVVALASLHGGASPSSKDLALAVRTMLRSSIAAWARERISRRARSEAARESAARRKAGQEIARLRGTPDQQRQKEEARS